MTGESGAPTTTFGGKYRPIATLGQGGMARVLLTVTQSGPGVHKLLVVKELKPDLVKDTEFVTMFVDEARLAARLNHPNVLVTYEIGDANGAPFLVMEYLEGQPLHAVLPRVGRASMPLPVHLAILQKALAGLHYAHGLRDFDGSPMNVVHRDVSPQNVFVCYDGQVKLLDFGIAKASGSVAKTETGVFKGKLGYIAPEQITSPTVDRRADVFSVGVMLWEALTWRRLTQGDPEAVVISKRTSGNFPRVKDINPDAPPDLVRICERAMALMPEDRWPTAAAMQAAIDEYMVKAGLRVTDKDVGDLVAGVFSTERNKIRAAIESQLASATMSGSFPRAVLPNLGLTEPMSGSTPPPPGVASAAILGAETPGSLAPSPATLTLNNLARPSPLRASLPWLVGGGIAALVGIVGGVVLVVERSHADPAQPTTSNAAPTANATTSSLSTAPAPDASITLDLRAQPPGAKLALDDKNLGVNPFHAEVPKDGKPHVLRVTAPGYTAEERMLVFDRSVDVSVALIPVTLGSGVPAPTGTDTAGGDLKKDPKPKHTIDEKDPYK